MGSLPLKRVTLDDINNYQATRLREKAAPRTIGMEMELLRLVLKRAKLWHRMVDDFKMLPRNTKEIEPLSPEQERKLIEVSRSKPEWINARCAMLLALNTSMRSCEIKGLQWRHVDLIQKTVRIERATTKTAAGIRLIPLNSGAMEAILELHGRADTLEIFKPEFYVFPKCENARFKKTGELGELSKENVDGSQPMRSWRTAWRKMLAKAGIAGWTFHSTRHQAITKLAEQGINPGVMKSIAGHTSQRLLDHYSHIRLAARRAAVEQLEEQAQPERPADDVTQPTVVN
jgi:integrase